MIMNKLLNLIIWPVLLAPVIYLALVWNSLPNTLATHFDLHGNPDQYSSKSQMWIYIPLITVIGVLIYLLLPLAYKVDPKKSAVENKTRLKRLAIAIAIFTSFIGCVIINSAIKGNIRLNIRLVFGSMGLFWCIIGNYMYNLKPNYFAGLRLPWTLSDEENWKKTHWLAGKLWFAGGLLILIIALLLPETILIIATMTVAMLTAFVPAVYSYRLYRKQKRLIENKEP
jgi:uncharacterized membrane protein